MAKLLYHLGRWSYINRWKVIIAWIFIVAAAGGATLSLMKPMTTEYSISGTPAIDATRRAVELFPENGNPANAPTVNLVFKAPEGEKLSDPQNEVAVGDVVRHIAEGLDIPEGSQQRWGNPLDVSPALQQQVIEQFTSMGLPEETARADADNLAMVNADETIAYTTFDFDAESPYSVDPADKDVVHEAMDIGRAAGLEVEAGGAGFGDEIQVNSISEVIGLAVAFIVLIITFGSLASAGMPLISAVVGVGLGAMGVMIATHWIELNNLTPVLAVMIGLAVGIDYALFIMSRYRQERSRMDGPDAAGMAVGTAGSSVVFAGATVFIALFALLVARISFLTAMGLAAAGTVFMAVLVALTLVPAMLGLLGDKAFAGRIPGVAGNPTKRRPRRTKPTMGNRWVRTVQRVPGVVMALVVLGLGALTAPVLHMELALPADTTSNPDTTQRKAADLLSEGFGPGINGPFLVIVDGANANPDSAALQPYIQGQEGEEDEQKKAALSSFIYSVQRLNQVGGVKHAQLVGVSKDMKSAQIMVSPTTAPTDDATVGTASALRTAGAELEDATGAEIGMTGLTAVQLDITERLEEAMGPYLAIVVGLAIFLLLAVFRSILVPLVAGLGFLLSVGGAFGLTVLVWQDGFTGLVPAPGPLISFMPIFLIGVTFGLAMDYQVFLVTRMREHFSRFPQGSGGKYSKYNANDEATIAGFTAGARVVTAAAIIMISVFVAFISQPLPFIQIFGFALAAGVLFDAFLVRMSLVPATMFLMGHTTWWMPKWLDKLIPQLDIEGTALEEEWERKHAAASREAEDKAAQPVE
ncbi:MMPL family transporter [Corynebacterium minutissimum]|uniref:Drug exporter of the RND superfamily n=1 Tax=Corynebacterium minutissimum TaxID=38301 RepID=A0A2X4RV41_9CORY|nr:MMPL family transporter [Corynebacterium minutissimum]KHO30555.1 multidrug RND transporter [Corynebacterium minutissimum]QPS60117.1 MMPL family transporter [Corynebacterium minutissimum]QQA79093.1 MMPL family transporter [Corynebacterium minutissimum]SQI01062.1 drug exporter of the RND superfamily [Corynebacterium minutissimum]VEG04871.1 drug exporter of the RND superfamily [Corynebacterium minutissimum]